MSELLSARLQVRVTPSLMQALRNEARRLRLRPADVARMALAKAVVESKVNVRERPAQAGDEAEGE